jgi:hypothetical protein
MVGAVDSRIENSRNSLVCARQLTNGANLTASRCRVDIGEEAKIQGVQNRSTSCMQNSQGSLVKLITMRLAKIIVGDHAPSKSSSSAEECISPDLIC